MHKNIKNEEKSIFTCFYCRGFLQRKTIIKESTGSRHWGDNQPYLKLADQEILSFICINCGKTNNNSLPKLNFTK